MKFINLNGVVILFMANLIGKALGAIYRIPLSNMLGAEGIGLYQMSFPIYSFLLTFITSGIGITLTRKIASLRINNNINEINKHYAMGKKVSGTFGLGLSFLIIVLAYPLSYIQGNTNAVLGYLVISLGFIFASKLSSHRGYFQGYGNMFPTAISQLIEQLVKLFLGLLFAYIFAQFGIVYGVIGALGGVVLGEIFANLYFKFKLRNMQINITFSKDNYKTFIKECLSVGFNYSILPMATLIDSFLVINLLKTTGLAVTSATSQYGIYTGMILPLINMPNILISAIALTSVPQISYAMAKKEKIDKQINDIFKFTFMFILPCVIGLFSLGQPILKVVYPTLSQAQLNIASGLLKYATIEMFFLCFLSVTNSIMQAINKTNESIKALIIGLTFKIIAMLISIPNANLLVYGASISNIVAYLIPCFINLVVIKKNTNSRVSFKYLILPIISSFVMLTFIICFKLFLVDISFVKLFLIIAFSGITYFVLLFVVKFLTIKDIKKILQKE